MVASEATLTSENASSLVSVAFSSLGDFSLPRNGPGGPQGAQC
jgi:hypothetical protein